MAPLTEVSDTTAELVESPPENPRQARRFRKGRFSQVPHISGLDPRSLLRTGVPVEHLAGSAAHPPRPTRIHRQLLLRRTGYEPVVGARRRPCSPPPREPQAHRLVAVDDLPVTDHPHQHRLRDRRQEPEQRRGRCRFACRDRNSHRARPEFYTRVRRGAGWKALGVLIGGMAVATVSRLGPCRTLPR